MLVPESDAGKSLWLLCAAHCDVLNLLKSLKVSWQHQSCQTASETLGPRCFIFGVAVLVKQTSVLLSQLGLERGRTGN